MNHKRLFVFEFGLIWVLVRKRLHGLNGCSKRWNGMYDGTEPADVGETSISSEEEDKQSERETQREGGGNLKKYISNCKRTNFRISDEVVLVLRFYIFIILH